MTEERKVWSKSLLALYNKELFVFGKRLVTLSIRRQATYYYIPEYIERDY